MRKITAALISTSDHQPQPHQPSLTINHATMAIVNIEWSTGHDHQPSLRSVVIPYNVHRYLGLYCDPYKSRKNKHGPLPTTSRSRLWSTMIQPVSTTHQWLTVTSSDDTTAQLTNRRLRVVGRPLPRIHLTRGLSLVVWHGKKQILWGLTMVDNDNGIRLSPLFINHKPYTLSKVDDKGW